MDRLTRSMAIHSTIDFALISLSCSKGTSFSKHQKKATKKGKKKKKTHIFDTFHVVDIPPLVVLPTGARARSGEQSRFVVVISGWAVAVKKGGRMAPGGSTHAAPAAMLQAIALSHLGFCCASRRRRQRLKDFLVVQSRVRVRVKLLISRIVAVVSVLSRRVFQGEQKKTVLDYAGSEEVLAFIIIVLRINNVSHCVAFIRAFAICI